MTVPEIETSPGYLVKRVQQSLRRQSDAALRDTGVSMAQYAALRALSDHPDATAAELARLCFVTRQSLQDLLAGLRAAELVEPADPSAPGRARAMRLTAAGRRRLSAADGTVRDVESVMLQGISVEKQRQLAALLLRCAQNLEAQ
jgi:DNA-binding MarR family transcriptional regulator